MPQFTLTIAGKAATSAGQTIYPSVIAASIVATSDPDNADVIAIKENEPLLDKANKGSTISIEFEGEEGTLYGSRAVLRKLIAAYPDKLKPKNDEVQNPPPQTSVYELFSL